MSREHYECNPARNTWNMTKLHDLPSTASIQLIVRAIITDHLREHCESFYKHPAHESEGYGLKAEHALFRAFTEAYPHWMCSFDEYREVLHEIHPVHTASNPSQP